MKLSFLIFALFASLSFANVGDPNAHVNCASNPLGASYNVSYPQLTLSGLVGLSHFSIINSTASTICCNLVTPSPINAPTSGNGQERCFPSNTLVAIDFTPISANVYCRSLSGTISSGTFDVSAW